MTGETCSCWQEEGSSIAAAFGPPRAKDGKISPLASRPLTGQRAKREDDEREDLRSVRRRKRGGRPELSGAMGRRETAAGPGQALGRWPSCFFFSLLLLQAPVDGSALCLSATGCLSSALQRQVPWRNPGASEGQWNRTASVRRWGWTPIAPDCVPCVARQRPPSSAQTHSRPTNPQSGLTATGCLACRPPSSLNRTCIRAQGARRLVARTAWPYCTWGGAATVYALSRPLKVKVPSPRPL